MFSSKLDEKSYRYLLIIYYKVIGDIDACAGVQFKILSAIYQNWAWSQQIFRQHGCGHFTFLLFSYIIREHKHASTIGVVIGGICCASLI